MKRVSSPPHPSHGPSKMGRCPPFSPVEPVSLAGSEAKSGSGGHILYLSSTGSINHVAVVVAVTVAVAVVIQ